MGCASSSDASEGDDRQSLSPTSSVKMGSQDPVRNRKKGYLTQNPDSLNDYRSLLRENGIDDAVDDDDIEADRIQVISRTSSKASFRSSLRRGSVRYKPSGADSCTASPDRTPPTHLRHYASGDSTATDSSATHWPPSGDGTPMTRSQQLAGSTSDAQSSPPPGFAAAPADHHGGIAASLPGAVTSADDDDDSTSDAEGELTLDDKAKTVCFDERPPKVIDSAPPKTKYPLYLAEPVVPSETASTSKTTAAAKE